MAPWHLGNLANHLALLALWPFLPPEGGSYDGSIAVARATDGSNTRMRRRSTSTNQSPSAAATRTGQIGRRSIRRSPETLASASGPGRHAPPVAVAIARSRSSSGGPNRYSAAVSGKTTRDPTPAVSAVSRFCERHLERDTRVRDQFRFVASGCDLPQHHVARRGRPRLAPAPPAAGDPDGRRSRPAPQPIRQQTSPCRESGRAPLPVRLPAAGAARAPARRR